MGKIIPKETPGFCLAITQASYEPNLKSCNGFLRRQYPNAEVLDECSVRGWKCILVRNEGRLSVAFQGTDKWHHWLGNIWHQMFGAFNPSIRTFEKQFDAWERLHNSKIELFTAHSGGTPPALAVRKTQDVARVIFNGHKACTEGSHISFLTSGDVLNIMDMALTGDPRADINNHFVLGRGGHGVDQFEPYFQNATWDQFQNSLNTSERSWNATQQLCDQLESGEIQLTLRALDPLNQDLNARAEMIASAERSKVFMEQFDRATRAMASKLQILMDQAANENRRLTELNHEAQDIERQENLAQDQISGVQRGTNYAALLHTVEMHRHPRAGRHVIDEIRELSKCYQIQMQRLIKSLGHGQDVDAEIRKQFTKLRNENGLQLEKYRELLHLQRSIGKKYRKLQILCKTIETIGSLSPDWRIVSSITASVAETILHYAYTKESNAVDKRISIQSRNLQRNLNSQQELGRLAETNHAGREMNTRAVVRMVSEISQDPYQIEPSSQIQLLSDGVKVLQNEIDRRHALIQEKEQEVDRDKKEIAKLESEEVQLTLEKRGQKKEKRVKIEDKVNKKQSERANLGVQLLSNEIIIQQQKDEMEVYKDELNKNQNALSEARESEPYRKFVWSIIKVSTQFFSSASENRSKTMNEVQAAIRLYEEATAFERRTMGELLGNIHQLALACGYQGHAIEALSAGYQLFHQARYWITVGVPSALELIKNYKPNVAMSVAEIGLGIASFINPAISLVLAGVQLINAIRAMCVKEKEKSPYQILFEEINKRLVELDKSIREALDKRIEELQEDVQKRVIELRELLARSTSFLSHQIEEFKNENRREHAQKEIDDSVSKWEMLDATNRNKFLSIWGSGLRRGRRPKQNEFESDEKDPSPEKRVPVDPNINKLQNVLSEFDFDLSTKISSITANSLVLDLLSKLSPDKLDIFVQTLGHALGEASTPNLHQTLMICAQLFEMLMRLKDSEGLEYILNNKKLRLDLSLICNRMVVQFNSIGVLSSKIPDIIKEIDILKRRMFQQIHQVPYHRYASNDTSATVRGFDWEVLRNLSADQKFYVHTEFTRNFPARMRKLQSALEPAYKRHFQIGTNYKLCKVFSLGFWWAGKSNDWIHSKQYSEFFSKTWSSMQSPEMLLRPSEKSEMQVFQRAVRDLRVGSSKSQEDGLKKLKAKTYHLGMDLKNREIVWRSQMKNHDVSLARFVVEDSTTKYELHSNQGFDDNVIQSIRATQGVPYAEYRQSLEDLIKGYRLALDILIQGQRIDPRSSPLHVLDQGFIVGSINPSEVPIVLPRKLIAHISKNLNPPLHLFDSLPGHKYMFRYEFSVRTRELILHLQVVSPSHQEPHDFAKFRLAIFDPITVESFKPDLTSDKPFNPSEFLIQALYGSYAQNPLGLPGANSFRLPHGPVVPNEMPFTGLYELWRHYPDRMIIYHSQYKTPESQDQQFVGNSIVSEPSVDYIQVIQAIDKHRSETGVLEVEYIRKYNLLKTLIRLCSGEEAERTQYSLEHDFELFAPDRLQTLHELGELAPLSQDRLHEFSENILERPSEFVRKLAQVQGNLLNVIDWLKGSSGLNITTKPLAYMSEDGNEKLLIDSFSSFYEPTSVETVTLEFRKQKKIFHLFNTASSGASALHALLGSSVDGVYQMRDCRETYVEHFRAKYERLKPSIDPHLVEFVENFLNNQRDSRFMYFHSILPRSILPLIDAWNATSDMQKKGIICLEFINKYEFLDCYLSTCLNDENTLSKIEIAIACQLFNKSALLYRGSVGSQYELMGSYGNRENEHVEIFDWDGFYYRANLQSI
ncbi:MAG: hypothetical protein JSS32_00785 [Verrucomicrobia bacterium]|nr:hypothetical protein [Verrucomicrobiota bacterium]